MNQYALLSIIISFAGVALMLFLFACWHYRYSASFIDGIKEFFSDIKRIILAPFLYFFGYSCPVCKKSYFSAAKADKCCKHRTVLYHAARMQEIRALEQWRKEHGATPAERRRKRWERFIKHFQRYECAFCHKGHWTAESAINCCKGKPTSPPYYDKDAHLADCYWCGGSGFKYGLPCEVCDGLGKLPRI